MRRLVPLAVLLSLACGSETPTDTGGLTPGTSVARSVTVEQGAGQEAAVERRFPAEVVARATNNAGNPVEGQSINFATRTDGGPTWQAGVLTTNAQGRVRQTPTAGTVAWTSLLPGDSAHTIELVASNDGAPDVVATFSLVQQPGPITDTEEPLSSVGATGGPVTLPGTWVADDHGNPALWRVEADSVVSVTGTSHGHPDARTISPLRAGSAVACAYDTTGAAVLPMYVEVSGPAGERTVRVTTQGDPDRDAGVTLSDC